jgi:hypothetical protein
MTQMTQLPGGLRWEVVTEATTIHVVEDSHRKTYELLHWQDCGFGGPKRC